MKLTSLLLIFVSGTNGNSETYNSANYSPAEAFVAKTWERVDALTSLETRLEDHQDLVGINTLASWGTSTIGVVLLPIAAPTGAVVWGAGVLGHMFTSMHDCFVSGEASKERREIMLKNGYDRELADFIRVHMQLDMSVNEIRQFYVEDKPSSSSKLGAGGLLTKISTKVAESKELSPELADSPNMMKAAVNALATDATNIIKAMEAGKWTQQIALSTQTYAVVASVWLVQTYDLYRSMNFEHPELAKTRKLIRKLKTLIDLIKTQENENAQQALRIQELKAMVQTLRASGG